MAVSSMTEVELKYAVPEGADLPPLTGEGIGGAQPEPVAHLEAVYLDTADRVLLAARIAVRRRTGGHDAGWHVKLPAATGRVELQAPIDPADPDRLPEAFERALRSRVRGAALVQIARIATERRGTVVTGASGTATGGGRVEVVDDAVHATDVAAGAERTWREWEAERMGGSPADDALLQAVDAVLRAAGATTSDSPAKLAQALGGAAAPAQRIDTATAGGLLTGRLGPLAEDLHRRVLQLVLDGDPDGTAVHALRKTLRRMRSLLALPVAGAAGADLRARLGALAGVLGEARDPLIAAGLAEALLDDLPEVTPGTAAARAALVQRPRAAAQAGTATAIEALIGVDALAAYTALDRLLADGPDGPGAGGRARRLVTAAKRSRRRARRRAARARDDLDALHAVRKTAKRFRMVVEELVAAGLVEAGSGLARSARRAARAQEALGDHRDLALLTAALPDASEAVTAGGGNAFAIGLVAAAARQRLGELERTARRRMRALRR